MARRSSILLLVALSLVWGSTWIANSLVQNQATPLALAALRYLVAALFLAAASFGQRVLRYLRKTSTDPSARSTAASEKLHERGEQPTFAILWALDLPGSERRSSVVISMLFGLTMFALPDLLLVLAAKHGAAAFTPLIYAALPLGLLLAGGMLRVPAILAVGAMLVLLNGSLPLSAGKLLWALPIVGAVFLQGASLVWARRYLALVGTVRACTVQCLIAAFALSLGEQFWTSAGHLPLRLWPISALTALGLSSGLAVAVAYPLYYGLLRNLTPAQLATSEWMQTLVAVGESALLLRQQPGWTMIAAACLLILCVVLLLRREAEATIPSLFLPT